MVILGSFGGSFWTIISKVPPIPLVFGKMGSKRALKNGHLGSSEAPGPPALLRIGSTDSESRGLSTKLDETDIHY
jgi:hypothetical protein